MSSSEISSSLSVPAVKVPSSAFIASVKCDDLLSCRRSLTSVELTVAVVQRRGGEESLRCPPARFLSHCPYPQ